MIEAHEVSYAVQGKTLVNAVSLEAHPGELLAIIGANGAGKSTLLKLLGKELTPSGGEIRMDGKPLSKLSREELAKFRAVLSQQHSLSFNFNVFDLVMMGRYPHFKGRPGRKDVEVVRQAMEITGVTHLTKRVFISLSGGEQQRVHLAKVLAQLMEPEESDQTRYLFMDEPINGLDLYYQHELLKIAHESARKGYCVIAILHDLNLTMQYADRVLILKKGQTVAFGEPDEVITRQHIKEAFQISVNLVRLPEIGYPIIIPDQFENKFACPYGN
ncbi:MAG: heme ABC transporter ATP-binding protein [Siphonobacter sp.]